MSEIVFTVLGTPTGKARPRFNPKTGHARSPHQTKIAEARVIEAWNMAGSPRVPDGPVFLNAQIALARPEGHWRLDGTLGAAGLRKPYPTKTPDLDNVLKLIMDALNGCAYRDDSCVVHAWVLKRWCNPGEPENTTISLRPAATPLLESVRRAA